ncbi:PilZ domain-containing protein [Bradyrhizobium sp. 31Argb]|uniref:PilZ domain-containing protein n=1 Tax=unclassified Bradyrhizobium TaxID=2631580 RepID=UPI00102E765E|nr:MULTISPECIES: PilZ domain-containing protein [unclassified Bradyrhizobium]MDI4236609.1 PilZ domain-containing protein [Bradyrhizobium sp. Arg237L]TAI61799.1 PilZ domain-containing protein [Bradyrhizobium sp. Leo170]
MAYGSRKAERVHFEHRYPVNLMGVDGTWQRSCVLLDVSQTGAKLEVEGALDVLRAQEFFLILSSRGLAFRRCELVRVDGMQIGVKFVAERKKKGRAIIPK